MSSSTQQVMMTLAALAATGATERPSGESLKQQKQRILTGINSQLANISLATAGQWRAIWVGLTASRANLAYIAKNNTEVSQYALCLRGTVAGSTIDTSEDMEVGLMLPFAAGGGGNISQGAMEAFTDIIMGTELMGSLGILAPSELYVTGHSLGGALVTTVSLYLLAQNFLSATSIYPYTFAAPTVGDQAFANLFDAKFPHAMCYYNYYDIVPYAWQNLDEIYKKESSLYPFYPNSKSKPISGPGPTVADELGLIAVIKGIADNTNGNSYVQPAQQPALNSPDGTPIFLQHYPLGAKTEIEQFEVQVGYQHANNTYLTLLSATPLPNVAPVVESVNPVSGPPGTAVTITPPDGCSFSPDSVVDFGIVPAASATVAQDGSTITAIAPVGVGTVDIRVTNIYGTSPVAPVYPNLTPYDYNDQFTFHQRPS